MSCSVQFQECTWNTSVHVTNVIFTAGREVNSSDSKSAISVVMAEALFQIFQHKLSVLLFLVRIKSSCCNSFLDFWIPGSQPGVWQAAGGELGGTGEHRGVCSPTPGDLPCSAGAEPKPPRSRSGFA